MEADWSVEIGADLPVIVVPWEGFVDLRSEPMLASGLPETAAAPIMAQWLVRLNREASPVITSKCDLWRLSQDEIDPLEFDATREEAKHGLACYIDIVAREASLFASFLAHEAWARSVTNEMRQIKLRQARADLVVRRAMVNEQNGYAVTVYVTACDANLSDAEYIFGAALEIAAMTTTKLASGSLNWIEYRPSKPW